MIETLVRRTKGLARRLVGARAQGITITWPAGRLEKLRPMRSFGGRGVMNKAGRVVLRGELDGVPIKLYEAWTPDHARFIEAASRLPGVGELFPAVLAIHGRCVVARWVDGEPFPDTAPLDELVDLQMRIHAVAADRLPKPGYDFWDDFLRPRAVRAADMTGVSLDDVVARVDAAMATGARSFVHPDFRPVNLIRTPGGRVTSIDNEYCAVSSFRLLDVCHTADALGDRAQAYWRTYTARAGTPAPTEVEALAAAWLARLVGSAFVIGRIDRAAALIQKYRAGASSILPFSV